MILSDKMKNFFENQRFRNHIYSLLNLLKINNNIKKLLLP